MEGWAYPFPKSVDASRSEVTRLLKEWSDGRQDALDMLLPQIYAELRRLASSYLRRERSDHTLQATALVHEAFIRLVDQRAVRWQNRAHFFGIAAQAMRRILVDHARAHAAEKRGSGERAVSLDEAVVMVGAPNVDLLALDEVLTRLADRPSTEPRRRVAFLRRPHDGGDGGGDGHIAGDRRQGMDARQGLVVRRTVEVGVNDWARVKEIFHGALERDPVDRVAFLNASCGHDGDMRAEVDRLLAAHERAGSFIEASPVAMTGRVIGHYRIDRALA